MGRKFFKSVTAWALIAAVTTAFTLMPAGTASAYAAEKIGDGVSPTCDEAYYATMDYYGNLTEGSVVKSYAMNGVNKLTDYGTYDEINNLTDGTVPKTENGKTVFDFGDSVPNHFYFEGKTTKPFEKLPWTISMSYKLNGVPTKAEDLAGKVGVVDIDLDFVPNDKAGKYAKNNYTLEAMAIFNQDDILSLEAEGAQVQLIGNLRVVLFVCLPGEENHFTIRVGSEDFSFGGMTYLMVPATLSQLDMLSGLADDKDSIENDYQKLNNSLDILLNSVGSMGGSLREAADGLDQLNNARKTISDGKGTVEDDIDVLLDDLTKLTDQLEPAKKHISTLRKAFDEITDSVNTLHDKAYKLKSNIGNISEELDNISYDLEKFRRNDTTQLQKDTANLSSDLLSMRKTLSAMSSSFSDLEKQLGSDDIGGTTEITIKGLTVSEIKSYTETATNLYNAYIQKCTATGQTPSTEGYVAFMTEKLTPKIKKELIDSGVAEDVAAQKAPAMALEQAKTLAYLYQQSKSDEFQAQLEQAEAVNSLLKSTNMTVSQLKKSMEDFSPMTKAMLGDLSNVCTDLSSLSLSLNSLLYKSEATLSSASNLMLETSRLLEKTKEIMDDLDELNKTVNKYIPEAKDTLAECEEIADTAQTSLKNLNKFLKDLKSLLKSADDDLDQGTKKALKGLAQTLRKTAKSTDTTGDVKAAKNDISDIVERLWNDHTGDVDNLLNMDASAKPVSLTSTKNDHPQSVQVLIRSQEIKVNEDAAAAEAAAAADNSTFFGRIAQMFKDLWAFITGIFS